MISGARRPSPPLRILMADDSESSRLAVHAFLMSSDMRMDFAADGESAVRMFEATQYDLVLMDIRMPVCDGWEATRRIRAMEKRLARPAVPIIALTALDLKEDREKSLAAGCDAHMTTPIDKRVLMRAVYQLTRSGERARSRLSVPEGADSLDKNAISEELLHIIPRFLENYRKSCLVMEHALSAGDHPSIRAEAHKIKGSGGSCGFPHISEIGILIERAAIASDTAGVRSGLDQLAADLDEIRRKHPG